MLLWKESFETKYPFSNKPIININIIKKSLIWICKSRLL